MGGASIKLLVKGFGKYKAQLVVLMWLGLISGFVESIGIAALVPLFTRLAGDGISNDVMSRVIGVFLSWFGQGFGFKALLIFIALAFILKSVILVVSNYISAKISTDYERETRNVLFAKTLQATWPRLIQQRAGHLETLLITDVSMSSSLFALSSAIVMSVASLVAYTAIAFSISPTITLISLALGGVIFLALKPLLYKIRELSGRVAETNSDMIHHVSENIAGAKTIKSSSVEERVIRKAMSRFKSLRDIRLRVHLLKVASSTFMEPISIIFVITVFAFLYQTGRFEIGVFAVSMYLIHRIFQHTHGVQEILSKVNERMPYLQRAIDFREGMDSCQEALLGTKPFKFQNCVRLHDVGFVYPGHSKEVLSNFNLEIRHGEMLGIIGESGSGKTTIVDLLLRLFDPVSGKIFVDDVNISEVDLKEWRNNIGYVSQDIFIINDTIRNNIRFYSEEISEESISRAAKQAFIYDFIMAQEKKMDTLVGERGVLLSGGEKQRIALARILARNPQILILDEATSALDNKSELMIQKAIESLKGRITVLVIAHRLSTILNCDRVVFLGEGRVKEEDVPSSLLADKDSHFYKLYNIRDL